MPEDKENQMILNSEYMNYIRSHALLADESEDEEYRKNKYQYALCMLVDVWRRSWPDCFLKATSICKDSDSFETEIFVELPPYSYPGGSRDRFRAPLRFSDSDDLVIDFCRVAKGVTDQFYDWQQDMLRNSLQMSQGVALPVSPQSSPKPKNAQ